MGCLILPVSMLTSCYSGSRLRYQQLAQDGHPAGDEEEQTPVTVVVGKERKEFLVDPIVLQENPFRILIESATNKKKKKKKKKMECEYHCNGERRVILADVDSILFEHMLWLMHNDCSSLFQLNLKEIIDFYAQDY